MSPAKKAKVARHTVKKAAKARKHAAKKKAAAPRGPDDDFSVAEWCQRRRIGRVLFYKMLKEGTAPKTMKIGKRRTISPQADAEWQQRREAETMVAAAA